jgi:hypothetical protein
MSYGNISVTSSATLIKAENKHRTSLIIRNNGTAEFFYGLDSSVTVANGFPVKADEVLNLEVDVDKVTLEETLYTGPIYGIAATTQDVRFVETDDVTDVRKV